MTAFAPANLSDWGGVPVTVRRAEVRWLIVENPARETEVGVVAARWKIILPDTSARGR